MKFKIVSDSCGDMTAKDLEKEYFVSVPLILNVGGVDVIDDETFRQKEFIKKVADCPDCPKSSCPAPDVFMKAYEGADEVFVVALSSKLSGSYNSAQLAKTLFLEDHPDVKIHVFDSWGASSSMRLLYQMIERLKLEGVSFDDIVKKVTKFIKEYHIFFVLEDLETLRKNGRLSNFKATIANALNIKPYCQAIEGEIVQIGQARGVQKAIKKLIDEIAKAPIQEGHDKLIISECNCLERAKHVMEMIKEVRQFKEYEIISMHGVSTMYANNGGFIVSF